MAGALLVWIACIAAVSAAPPKFDGRAWTIGNQQKNETESLTEYVLPGQTVDDWKELVTSTVFFQPVPLAPFVEKIHASLSTGCLSLVWNVVQQDQKTVVFEWRDAGCGGFEPQDEMDRVTIAKDGLYRLAYAAKVKGPLAPATRKRWLEIFAEVPLAEGPVGDESRPGATSGPDRQAAPAVPALSTEQLAAGVRRSGWTCPSGVKSSIKGQTQGPKGPLTVWILNCSNDQEFTVLVDPTGSITAFPSPK